MDNYETQEDEGLHGAEARPRQPVGRPRLAFRASSPERPEVPDFDLLRALNRGLVPQHYDTVRYGRALAGYVDDYLKEEVFDEGLTRNAPAFSRFFDALSCCHGELLNYSNVDNRRSSRSTSGSARSTLA